MLYIIDRIEGEFAVCEDESGKFVELPTTGLPSDLKEGDVLRRVGDSYFFEMAATDARRRAVGEKIQRVFIEDQNS